MGKKAGKAAAKKTEEEEAPAADEAPKEWTCADCGFEGNPAEDEECMNCGAARPAPAGDPRFEDYVVGLVKEVEAVAGKDKLKKLVVDVGEGEPLTIASNAGNIKDPGVRVVVAKVGAIVDGEPLKKATVGGVPSEGMICDGGMLGWVGGGAGAAAILPESFAIGGPPPDARPRMDGK
eukprot:TRINITY_DN17996_c0_g1_i1.p1 TRINITY_DN17996_c0_g1~~TRINITY_DN17996_c0_g1_i1.p1  ORF type:complete len:178 (-),score=59.86 TRINITY_DN17996_c0_g1_i1:139-672(-)